MTSIRIEICKSYKKNCWNLRIGDIEGCSENTNITKNEVLAEISEEMEG